MTITIGRWGIGLVIGGFVMDLFLQDVYLRVPRLGELAWNPTGFYVDRENSQMVNN